MTITRIAAALAAALVLSPAAATNWSVLNHAPITRMSEADAADYRDTVLRTLDSGEDGKTVEWAGKEKGARSRLTPLRSYESNGMRCRDIRLDTQARELKAQGTYTFCKSGSESWQFKVPAAKPAAGQSGY